MIITEQLSMHYQSPPQPTKPFQFGQ